MGKQKVFPTKGNLMATQKSLVLAKNGQTLMDRKRNILMRELVSQLDVAKRLRDETTEAYNRAYQALQLANMSLGRIDDIVTQVPIDDGLTITYYSVMGIELPKIHYDDSKQELAYGLERANSDLDRAYQAFNKVKSIMLVLTEVENAIYRLAHAIRKTQKRSNALKNVVIPQYAETIKYIENELEEKEREEFIRQKIIKAKTT